MKDGSVWKKATTSQGDKRPIQHNFQLVSGFMAYQIFLGYLMPKPFSEKNSSGTI